MVESGRPRHCCAARTSTIGNLPCWDMLFVIPMLTSRTSPTLAATVSSDSRPAAICWDSRRRASSSHPGSVEPCTSTRPPTLRTGWHEPRRQRIGSAASTSLDAAVSLVSPRCRGREGSRGSAGGRRRGVPPPRSPRRSHLAMVTRRSRRRPEARARRPLAPSIVARPASARSYVSARRRPSCGTRRRDRGLGPGHRRRSVRTARLGSGRHHHRCGGLEALEGQVEAERELPQGDREGREPAQRGVLLDDAEQRQDGGGEEQGGPMSPSMGRTRGTRPERYSRVPSSSALRPGMRLCPSGNVQL